MMHRSRGGLYVVAIIMQLLFLSGHVAQAQLTITATTPSSVTSGSPNTFVGAVGNQIAASLLASGTPALLWGSVPSSDIITACQQVVNTGSLSFSASVTNDWGGSEDLTLQVQATGGCLAASDGSGTEFVFVDNYGRKSAVVCPSNAGSIGCGVYVTGDDVNAIYDSAQGGSKRKLLSATSATSRRLLDDCNSGAKAGAISGAVTGVLGAGECLALGPLAPFCIAGVIGVSAEVGALGGCASSCFPGDALVATPGGGVRLMSQLQLGDEVAVWGHNGRVQYDRIYAFGHKDANVTAIFVEITTVPRATRADNGTTSAPATATIRLSGLHFIPTSSSLTSPRSTVAYKRAKDVHIGDIVWSFNSLHLDANQRQPYTLPYVVIETSTYWSRGLYNPVTLSGTILVDNVVASAHSDWFLDATFDILGLSQWLPQAYQLVLAPVRALYHVLGQETYVLLYTQLDACIDIAKFGTNYGGALMASTFALTLLLLRRSLTVYV